MPRTQRQTEPAANSAKTRVLVIAVILFTWMLVIIWRLAWLQIARHEEFKAHAASIQQKELAVKATRGEIVDRRGNPFALSLMHESLYADPRMLREKEDERSKTARLLAPVLGLPPAELLQQLSSAKPTVWLKRQMSVAMAEQARQVIRKNKLSAVSFVQEPQRVYPSAQLAAHVIGTVSADERGIEGLEQVLENKLRGTPGKTELEQNALGQAWARLDTAAVNGARIVTTLDSALQHKVEVILAGVLANTHARSVTAIVLDPNNGEVLALANAPAFDPNERPKAHTEARRNRAITDAYEPGSVFKLVAYAAALEEGLARPTDLLNCQGGTITLGRHTFHDSHLGTGVVTVAAAFAKSSNVGAIKLAQRLGEERLFQWIKRFGFNQRTGLELPGEVTGFLRPTKDWHVDSIGSLAIGQEISVTPLQTLAAYAAIANRGEWVKPHLIQKIVAPSGTVLWENQPETRRLLQEPVARQMTEMMQFVVSGGTGRAAGKLAGYTAAGKTGTPEKYVKGIGYKSGKFTPTFVGFVPATKPRFAIIVLIDEPVGLHQGGQIAAPAFNLIAEAALTDYLVLPDDAHFRAELARLIEKAKTEAAEQPAQAEAKGDAYPALPTTAAAADNSTMQQASAKQLSHTDAQKGEAEVALKNRLASALPGTQTKAQSAPSLGDATIMPDLRGLSLRAVAQACGKLNLRTKLSGSGQAIRQAPLPGARIKPGSTCQVEFR